MMTWLFCLLMMTLSSIPSISTCDEECVLERFYMESAQMEKEENEQQLQQDNNFMADFYKHPEIDEFARILGVFLIFAQAMILLVALRAELSDYNYWYRKHEIVRMRMKSSGQVTTPVENEVDDKLKIKKPTETMFIPSVESKLAEMGLANFQENDEKRLNRHMRKLGSELYKQQKLRRKQEKLEKEKIAKKKEVIVKKEEKLKEVRERKEQKLKDDRKREFEEKQRKIEEKQKKDEEERLKKEEELKRIEEEKRLEEERKKWDEELKRERNRPHKAISRGYAKKLGLQQKKEEREKREQEEREREREGGDMMEQGSKGIKDAPMFDEQKAGGGKKTLKEMIAEMQSLGVKKPYTGGAIAKDMFEEQKSGGIKKPSTGGATGKDMFDEPKTGGIRKPSTTGKDMFDEPKTGGIKKPSTGGAAVKDMFDEQKTGGIKKPSTAGATNQGKSQLTPPLLKARTPAKKNKTLTDKRVQKKTKDQHEVPSKKPLNEQKTQTISLDEPMTFKEPKTKTLDNKKKKKEVSSFSPQKTQGTVEEAPTQPLKRDATSMPEKKKYRQPGPDFHHKALKAMEQELNDGFVDEVTKKSRKRKRMEQQLKQQVTQKPQQQQKKKGDNKK